MTRPDSQIYDPRINKIVADYLDFTDTVATDYAELSSGLESLLGMAQTFSLIAMLMGFGYFVLYEAYVAPTSGATNNWLTFVAVVVFEASFGYLLWKSRRSRGQVEHLDFHMYEAVEMYANTVIDTKTVDSSISEAEQIVELLRNADTDLDEHLSEAPELIQLNAELHGKKGRLFASLYVGTPWKGRVRRALRSLSKSRIDEVWIAILDEGKEALSVAGVEAIHDKLADFLTYVRPSVSQIYLFSRQGFSPEAVIFVDDEKTWIPHWKEGTDEEFLATINLVQLLGNGRFSVVTQPWLKTLRQERLATSIEV